MRALCHGFEPRLGLGDLLWGESYVLQDVERFCTAFCTALGTSFGASFSTALGTAFCQAFGTSFCQAFGTGVLLFYVHFV